METEKRLIDANALLAELTDRQAFLIKEWGHRDHYARGFVETVDRVNQAPTVDAVEVVRCKDCMWARPKDHREPTETPRNFICQCAKHHYIPAPWGARLAVNAEDFCSYGERRAEYDTQKSDKTS